MNNVKKPSKRVNNSIMAKAQKSYDFNSDKHLRHQLDETESLARDVEAVGSLSAYMAYAAFFGGDKVTKDKELSTGKKIGVGILTGLAAGGLIWGLSGAFKKPDVVDPIPIPRVKFSADMGPADMAKVLPQLNDTELTQILGDVYNVSLGSDVSAQLNQLLNSADLDGELIVSSVDHFAPIGDGFFNFSIKNKAIKNSHTKIVNNYLSGKIYDLAIQARGGPVEYEGSGVTPASLTEVTDLIELKDKIDELIDAGYTNQPFDLKNITQQQKLAGLIGDIPELQGLEEGDLLAKLNAGNDTANNYTLRFLDTQDNAPGTPNGGGSVAILYRNGNPEDLYVLSKESTAIWVAELYGNQDDEGTRSIALPKGFAVDKIPTTRKQKAKWLSKYGLTSRQTERMGSYVNDIVEDMKDRVETYTVSKLGLDELLVTGINKKSATEMYVVKRDGVYQI